MVTTFRLFDAATVVPAAARANNDVFGTEFILSKDQRLYGIWYYSVAGALALPTRCSIWRISDQTLLFDDQDPAWSAAAGAGWVHTVYAGSSALPGSIKMVVGVYHDASVVWRTNTGGYWSTGDGAGGVTNGPISAPNLAGSVNGQGVFATGFAFPGSTGASQNFWSDAEVGDPPPVFPGAAAVSRRIDGSARTTQRSAAAGAESSLASHGIAGQTVSGASTSTRQVGRGSTQ
jgi:hypothetical protein